MGFNQGMRHFHAAGGIGFIMKKVLLINFFFLNKINNIIKNRKVKPKIKVCFAGLLNEETALSVT